MGVGCCGKGTGSHLGQLCVGSMLTDDTLWMCTPDVVALRVAWVCAHAAAAHLEAEPQLSREALRRERTGQVTLCRQTCISGGLTPGREGEWAEPESVRGTWSGQG